MQHHLLEVFILFVPLAFVGILFLTFVGCLIRAFIMPRFKRSVKVKEFVEYREDGNYSL